MRQRLTAAVLLSLSLATALAAPAQAAPATGTGTGTITVPSDFVPALSDTRATGHYEVAGTGLRIWTGGATSTDKVAEYVGTSTPLADAGEPSLALTNNTTGTIPPGFQLQVDFDGDGSVDGILVGETVYGGDWWASNGSKQFVKDGAPSHAPGSGSANHGTLDQWRSAFPNAKVLAFGFSLGSGVKGDWTIGSLTFAGTTYTFRQAVVLTSAAQCKDGGWATSTTPVFRNQGQCVSSFARAK